MADKLLFLLTLFAALGSGLIAGAFFAFSSFVMKALSRLPASEGMAAMQSINVVVLNPLFLGVFVGTAAACGVGLVFSFLHWNEPGVVYLLAGSLLYLIGTFLVTMVFNVPLNDALAAVAPSAAEAKELWAGYLDRWTVWNHVRTIAALAAAASFTNALRY
jgi:uncharacterized membrane protein